MSSVCRWFRVGDGRMWSSCSCSRPVHRRWSRCARNCTSSHRGRHGCCAPRSKSSSTWMSTDATSTDRHWSCSSPSERSSSRSTTTRRDGALQHQTTWCKKRNNEGSVNGVWITTYSIQTQKTDWWGVFLEGKWARLRVTILTDETRNWNKFVLLKNLHKNNTDRILQDDVTKPWTDSSASLFTWT